MNAKSVKYVSINFNSRKKSKISNIKSFSCDSEMRKGVDEGLI